MLSSQHHLIWLYNSLKSNSLKKSWLMRVTCLWIKCSCFYSIVLKFTEIWFTEEELAYESHLFVNQTNPVSIVLLQVNKKFHMRLFLTDMLLFLLHCFEIHWNLIHLKKALKSHSSTELLLLYNCKSIEKLTCTPLWFTCSCFDFLTKYNWLIRVICSEIILLIPFVWLRFNKKIHML